MVERAAQYPLHFHPGDRWDYGDSTDYVAILVEKISGQSIDDFLRDADLRAARTCATRTTTCRARR